MDGPAKIGTGRDAQPEESEEEDLSFVFYIILLNYLHVEYATGQMVQSGRGGIQTLKLGFSYQRVQIDPEVHTTSFTMSNRCEVSHPISFQNIWTLALTFPAGFQTCTFTHFQVREFQYEAETRLLFIYCQHLFSAHICLLFQFFARLHVIPLLSSNSPSVLPDHPI